MSGLPAMAACLPTSFDALDHALSGTAPILSIHDVMPETLPGVDGILKYLAGRDLPRPHLLIVPGRTWRTAQLAQLRAWTDAGVPLAGHGWSHQSAPPRSLYHRLHSNLISRNVAEHLALDADAIEELLHLNHAWFAAQYLPTPSLYVPPAWAIGAISRARLKKTPFRFIETLTGIYDSHYHLFHTLPLVGYEADTPLRAAALRCLNAANRAFSRAHRRPLRIAIHPHDFNHRLAGDLMRLLEEMAKTA